MAKSVRSRSERDARLTFPQKAVPEVKKTTVCSHKRLGLLTINIDSFTSSDLREPVTGRQNSQVGRLRFFEKSRLSQTDFFRAGGSAGAGAGSGAGTGSGSGGGTGAGWEGGGGGGRRTGSW
jgi:hypothetical protein